MMIERPRCTQCALHLGATNVKVKSRGSDKPLLLFVGEAPGRDEDRTGECSVGAAGQEFDRLLELASIDFKYCRWTNVVRCVPWGDRPKTRTPESDEIEACLPNLEAEILSKDPVFIVTLGNTALHALLPKAPLIGKSRKRRHFLELPSLRYRYRKAVLFARAANLGIAPPSIPNDKGMKQFILDAESLGCPHEETEFFTVYPTYHPSASVRNKQNNPAIELAIIEDLGYLRTQVTGDRGIPFESYEYLSTLEEIRDHLEYIKQLYLAGKIPAACIDLETTGLSPYLTEDAKVVLFSIAYGEGKAFSIPFEHHESPFVNDLLAKRAIVAMVQDFLEVVPTVNHNYKFDLHWLAFMGIEISKVKVVGDSMLSSWTLWNDTIQDHSLEALATRHVGMISHKEEMDQAKQDAYLRLLDAGEERQPTMDDIEIDIVSKYCCADTDSCLRLWVKFEALMTTEGLYDPHHQVCVPAIVPTAAMEIAGVRCDLELLKDTQKELEQQLQSYYDQLEEWNLDVEILKALNIRALDKGKSKAVTAYKLTAPAAKSALIFDVLEFQPTEYGKSGPSVDKGVIGNLMELCTANMAHDEGGEWSFKLKVLDLVRNFNATHTLLSRYVKPIPQYVDKKSICHSNFGIRTTRTGRYNSQKPSFHQMPWRSAVKRSFQPHHPHGLILSADYSQMELRVLAAVTQDPDMMAAFISGQDIHRLIASMVLNKPPEEVLTAERRRIKTVVFGICYGRSARSIAVQEHVSEAAAQELIDKFFYRFPRVKEWVKKQHSYAKKHGKVYSPFGFVRLLESYLSDYERNNRAVNTPIQGSASDIGICGMRNVYRLLTRAGSPFKTTMFAQVHDSILFSTYPGEVYDVLTLCNKGMVEMPPREIPWLTVPIRADFEIGPSWGELIEVKRLSDRQILFEKAPPALHERMCEIFMSWDDPPEMINEEKVLELEDGSQLYQSLSSVKIREAVKEEFYNSTWQFPQFIQAA